jgi:cupin fold WbuC family metalloprotein
VLRQLSGVGQLAIDYRVVDSDAIQSLIAAAFMSPRRTARICLHRDHTDPVQEMVIAVCEGGVFSAHRHPATWTESYHVMVGALQIDFFSDDLAALVLSESIILNSNDQPLYRLNSPTFHAVRPASPVAVYHEVLRGPYVKDDVVFAHPMADAKI